MKINQYFLIIKSIKLESSEVIFIKYFPDVNASPTYGDDGVVLELSKYFYLFIFTTTAMSAGNNLKFSMLLLHYSIPLNFTVLYIIP